MLSALRAAPQFFRAPTGSAFLSLIVSRSSAFLKSLAVFALKRLKGYPLAFRAAQNVTTLVGSTASASTCISATFPFVSIT